MNNEPNGARAIAAEMSALAIADDVFEVEFLRLVSFPLFFLLGLLRMLRLLVKPCREFVAEAVDLRQWHCLHRRAAE
jgi:hypothetical protein